jgi:hypothetical protein
LLLLRVGSCDVSVTQTDGARFASLTGIANNDIMVTRGETDASKSNCYVINAAGIVRERRATDGCVSAVKIVIKRANTDGRVGHANHVVI